MKNHNSCCQESASQKILYRDPVCGMTTEDEKAYLKFAYQGKPYYFCSPHCLAKFKADPKGEEKLLHHLSSGEKAKFPDGHEEAHMIVKSDDPKEIQNLVDWILSL